MLRPRSIRRRAYSPAMAALEPRTLLSVAGDFDPTFGSGGSIMIPAEFNAGFITQRVQSTGKIVVAGSAYRPSDLPGASGSHPRILVERFNTDGSIDATFGQGGSIVLPELSPSFQYETTRAVLIQPDDKIVVGYGFGGVGQRAGSGVFRLNADGSGDATFNNGAVARTPTSSNTNLSNTFDLNALALEPDGQIVAGGSAYVGDFGTDLRAVLTRLNADGSQDTAFGTAGVTSFLFPLGTYLGTTQPATTSQIDSLAVLTDGRIVAAPNSFAPLSFIGSSFPTPLLEFNPDGSPNTTFGGSGVVSVQTSGLAGTTLVGYTARNLIALPGGKFLVSGVDLGYPNQDAVPTSRGYVARLTADGALDPTFGGTGQVFIRGQAGASNFGPIALQPDGKILAISPGGNDVEIRLNPDGTPDKTFGTGGSATLALLNSINFIDPTADGSNVVFNGGVIRRVLGSGTETISPPPLAITTNQPLAATPQAVVTIDAGRTDVAVYLASLGAFAVRPAGGGPDQITPFGIPGTGQSTPVAGDFDGDTRPDLAVYLPAIGAFAYRPSHGGADVIVGFGAPGAGQSIPAVGDFDADGRTDLAVYLPSLGAFAYRPSSSGADVFAAFGSPGEGQSIPAVGDFDASGHTEFGVFLPVFGAFAYRAADDTDKIIPFGAPGAGQSIPIVADYDGDGRDDPAVYLPALGGFAYRSSRGIATRVVPFGDPGVGQSIPVAGDYDGDGRDDPAVYLPITGTFVYRPSRGGADVSQAFGVAGDGQTLPVRRPTVLAMPPATVAAAALEVPIPILVEAPQATRQTKGRPV